MWLCVADDLCAKEESFRDQSSLFKHTHVLLRSKPVTHLVACQLDSPDIKPLIIGFGVAAWSGLKNVDLPKTSKGCNVSF